MKYKIILFCIITALQLQSCDDSSSKPGPPSDQLQIVADSWGGILNKLTLAGKNIYNYDKIGSEISDSEAWLNCSIYWGVSTNLGNIYWLEYYSKSLPTTGDTSLIKQIKEVYLKELFELRLECKSHFESTDETIIYIICCCVYKDSKIQKKAKLSSRTIQDLKAKQTIKDKSFGNYLRHRFHNAVSYERNSDQFILYTNDPDVTQETKIFVRNKGIKDLQGIEYFKNLKFLDCSNNQLTALDLSQNFRLKCLYCQDNKLKELALKANTDLIELDCGNNQLTELDLGQNTKLETLDCHDNQIRSLDLSSLGKIRNLYVSFNSLTVLDLPHNSPIKRLYCQNNQLKELELNANTDLTKLDCGNNQLTELDLGQNTKLETLDCNHDQLASLDLRALGELRNLYVSFNSLTALDLSQNTCLERLLCQNNQLKELDLSANKSLTQLLAYGNEFQFTNGTKLTESPDGSSKPLVKGQELTYSLFRQLEPENVDILEAPPD